MFLNIYKKDIENNYDIIILIELKLYQYLNDFDFSTSFISQKI